MTAGRQYLLRGRDVVVGSEIAISLDIPTQLDLTRFEVGHKRRQLQVQRPGAVRCSAWLSRAVMLDDLYEIATGVLESGDRDGSHFGRRIAEHHTQLL